jgi:asparagine synthase (glutamine-hydrolysing)
MCGFIVAMSVDSVIDRDQFDRARDILSHRGPDGFGSRFFVQDRVALGHRRLSIIDLSEAGSQPMQSGSLWIVFNGEIYNFPELRDELEKQGCQFTSHSDTEVLLHGYRTWGSRLCERLEGMFAFAIYDEATSGLFVARDHVGQKPLHYAVVDGCFIAASEIKAIHSLVGHQLPMRRESFLDYLVYDYVPEPNTWYRDVRCTLPGHFMEVRHAGGRIDIQESRYWSYVPPVDPPPISKADALELMNEQIQRSVKSHLLSDVEVGALLSGGVDSGSIVATASQLTEAPLRTFTIGFGSSDEDELPSARLVASRYRTQHQEEIVGESDFRSTVDGVLDIFDQPFADTSLVPTLAVSSVAAKSVKVVLTGDGGDEVFGGYDLGKYISPFLGPLPWRTSRFDRGSANEFLKFCRDTLFYLCMPQARWNSRNHYPKYVRSARREFRLMPVELRRQLEHYEYRWMYPPNTVDGLDAFRQAQWHRIKHILPGRMLAKMDRCSMQHSIEARAPFLSHVLIEAMLNLPTSIKNPPAKWFKGLLREWASDRLPLQVLNARKRGFAVPKGWNALPQSAHDINALDRTVRHGLISPSAWPDLHRKSRVLWKVLQVDRAIARGLF